MNELAFLQRQAIELRRLLDRADQDPILGPQLRDRLNEVESELKAASHNVGSLLPREIVLRPRVAIFLRGGGVHGSDGIRASLAGDVLIQYEKLFTEQAIHDERQAARITGRQRRPKGAQTPTLLFTGTPRGSFGLEFVPQSEDPALLAVHSESFRNIANGLTMLTGDEATSPDNAVKELPPRMLQPLKQFLQTLAQHDAELRLAFHNAPSRTISPERIKRAAEWLDRQVVQESKTVEGIFRGVTRDSGVFDLRIAERVITGTVADSLTEEDLDRIDLLTNNPCTADVQETTVRTVGGIATATFVLLDASPLRSDPA